MIFEGIKKHLPQKEALIHVLIWVFLIGILHVNWTENWMDKSIRMHSPAPLSAILFPIFFYLNAIVLIPRFLKGKNVISYLILTLLVLFAVETSRSLVFVTFKAYDCSFYEAFLEEINSIDNLIWGSPNSMFFAFLFSFAYRFTKDWILNNQLIEKLKTEKVSMELSVLKAHINPHFLFNNLNTLDDLIDKDAKQAKAYLHKLSNIYRYSILQMEEDVVSLQSEWDFIDDYIYLIEERFDKVYQFEKTNEIDDLSNYLIPPASLQSLIENAIKHNQGSTKTPLIISIKADLYGVSVSHLKYPKISKPTSLGTGLNNLRARYKLLTNLDIQIVDTHEFSVSLPLIKQLSCAHDSTYSY